MPELTEQQIADAAELLREDGWKISDSTLAIQAILSGRTYYRHHRRIGKRRTPPCGWEAAMPPALQQAIRDAIDCVR